MSTILTPPRGVASVSIRSLAIAGESLVDHRERVEVLDLLKKIWEETGWKIAFITSELKDKWGWTVKVDQQGNSAIFTGGTALPLAPPPRRHPSAGLVNPSLANADFSLPTHPYQPHYVPPAANNFPYHNNFNL